MRKKEGGGGERRGEEIEKGNESRLPICKLQPKNNLAQRAKYIFCLFSKDKYEIHFYY